MLYEVITDIGLHEASEIDDASMRAIYSVTGGNPLALKMVVGLLDLVPLHQVLIDIVITSYSIHYTKLYDWKAIKATIYEIIDIITK